MGEALNGIEVLTPKKNKDDQTKLPLKHDSPVARKLSTSTPQSHDDNSLDEVTEIEILTPSKKQPDADSKVTQTTKMSESEPKPAIDCIDLEEFVDHQTKSKSKEELNSKFEGEKSLIFTKSLVNNQAPSGSSSSEVDEKKDKPHLQLRKDLWGKKAEIVDITEDDTAADKNDTSEILKTQEGLKSRTEKIALNGSTSVNSPVKLKSREELKGMFSGKEPVSSKNSVNDFEKHQK